jgi:O-antigen/teichoic acid export membrane protein
VNERKSYRDIFRSSAILGSSSLINILFSLVRTKVVAVLLGPSGVGLIGVYSNLLSLVATIMGFGLSQSGVRELALSNGKDEQLLEKVRRALYLGNLLLGSLSVVLLWLFGEQIAVMILPGVGRPSDITLIGIGVLFSLMAASRTTLLRGLRRIGDLASVSVLSGFLSTIVGLVVIALAGESGAVWFVLCAPVFTLIVSAWVLRKLPVLPKQRDSVAIRKQLLSLVRFGFPMMIAGFVTIGTELYLRVLIIEETGIESVGYFQASWAISVTYLGLLFGAMASDYYPRLTSQIKNSVIARKLVAEQSEMALLLGAPLVILMLVVASSIISILYTAEFEPASMLLRWLMLGTVIKLAVWPLGFVIIACGKSFLFIYTQLVWGFTFIVISMFALPTYDLISIGIAFTAAYLLHLANTLAVVYRLIGYLPNIRNTLFLMLLFLVCALLLFMEQVSSTMSLWAGVSSVAFVSIFSIHRLCKLLELDQWFRAIRAPKDNL